MKKDDILIRLLQKFSNILSRDERNSDISMSTADIFCSALTSRRSDNVLCALVDLCDEQSVKRHNSFSSDGSILVMALQHYKSDTVILYLLQKFPVLAALVSVYVTALPLYTALSHKRSLSVVVGLLICCPSFGTFDQTLCNERINSVVLIAITQSLSFWNAFAHKFEEGDPLSTVIEEAETVVKNQSHFDYELLHNSKLEEDMATIKNSIMESKNQTLILEEIKDLLLEGNKQTSFAINHNSKVDEDMA